MLGVGGAYIAMDMRGMRNALEEWAYGLRILLRMSCFYHGLFIHFTHNGSHLNTIYPDHNPSLLHVLALEYAVWM